jgi:hypothetical protein
VARIGPTGNATADTIDQIRCLVEELPTDREVPMFVFDAGYDPTAIGHGLTGTRAQLVTRIRDDRVFYTTPTPTTRRREIGRPPRHGPPMKCADPDTWGEPSATHTTTDSRYGTVTVTAWSDLHPRVTRRPGSYWSTHHHGQLPIVEGTLIRVEVEHLPKPTARTKKTLWLFHTGPDTPDLDIVWQAYLHRFDIEHSFRFIKNTLGWTTPAVCTPQQADRWTWIIAAIYTQLRLARGHVQDLRLPWELCCI